jgi:hypothetical protein
MERRALVGCMVWLGVVLFPPTLATARADRQGEAAVLLHFVRWFKTYGITYGNVGAEDSHWLAGLRVGMAETGRSE